MQEIFSNTDSDVARYLANETQAMREYIYSQMHIDINEKDPLTAEYLILNAFYTKINENVKTLNSVSQETENLIANLEMSLTTNEELQQQKFIKLTDSIKQDFTSASEKIVNVANDTLNARSKDLSIELSNNISSKFKTSYLYIIIGLLSANLISTMLLCLVILYR